MTVPLPVVPVVGAGVADGKLLVVVVDELELELVVVPVVVVALNAVPLDEDLPAYEAAAA
ncbi:MAG TPA: hypothetical protein VN973_05050 [Candidatus Dormibacteraeota bacterium]|nr:hypothetical protein [Candidatus Dormibacteraeota bacterium]